MDVLSEPTYSGALTLVQASCQVDERDTGENTILDLQRKQECQEVAWSVGGTGLLLLTAHSFGRAVSSPGLGNVDAIFAHVGAVRTGTRVLSAQYPVLPLNLLTSHRINV